MVYNPKGILHLEENYFIVRIVYMFLSEFIKNSSSGHLQEPNSQIHGLQNL